MVGRWRSLKRQFHFIVCFYQAQTKGTEIGLPSNFTLQCPQRRRGTSFFHKMRKKLKTLPKFPQANFYLGFYFTITIFVLNLNFHWVPFLLNLNTFGAYVLYVSLSGSFLRNTHSQEHLSQYRPTLTRKSHEWCVRRCPKLHLYISCLTPMQPPMAYINQPKELPTNKV
jgi:hypothetical protein